MLSPEVRTVLREIRKMPGRRVAGDRAEAFLRNPFATLGPDASKVIDPVQFENARDEAGISFASFTARALRDEKGYPFDCALLVEETVHGMVVSDELRFEGPQDLEKFVAKLDARITAGAQCCHWQGYDLEILGDTPDQLKLLREALRDMAGPSGVTASEIFDLSRYSERVEGFGVEKPYYSPFIARKGDDDGWFPENVDFGICYTPEGGGETVAVVLNDETIKAFHEELRKAETEKRETFDFPGCPKPIPVDWAKETLKTLKETREEVSNGRFDPGNPATKAKAVERKGLVVNHVVHFTRTWNPAKEDQATDRAYRIGQTKDVHVYYPVVVAQDFLTFDAKLDKLLDWKRGLSTDILNGAGDVGPADFSDLEAPDGGNAFGNELIGAEDIGSLNPNAFEAFCSLLWSKRGYTKTFKTPRVGDGGVDVLAIRGTDGVAIQCKSSGIEGRRHGWEAVKDISAGVPAYAQRYPNVKFSMVAVTNQLFNDTARQQAQVLSVELIDGNDLAQLVKQYPMKRWELEQFLLSEWAAS